MKQDKARTLALKILNDIEKNNAYSNISLDKHMEHEQNLADIDRAFATEIVYGCVKNFIMLDHLIQVYSSIKPDKISIPVLNILRMGFYQLLFMDKVPESAAVNESVKLAGKFANKGAQGYVNAVLRSFLRSGRQLHMPVRENEPIKYLSIKYSFPEWLVKRWIDLFGEEFCENLIQSSNHIPGTCIRVNRLRTDKQKLKQELQNIGIHVSDGLYIEEALYLSNTSSIAKLELFRRGLFQVQDESSMLAVKVLDPKPGEIIADVCAASGGKTTFIAELMGNKGRVVAFDIYEHRINLINNAAQRLGIDIIDAMLRDAREKHKDIKADRVLVDAPCSGLGIIRKKPDLKYAKNEHHIKELVNIQKQILEASADMVKAGGCLVYSTCTIEPSENDHIAAWFAENHANFIIDDISRYAPDKLKSAINKNGFVQLYPNVHGTDGFFIARFKKLKEDE